MTDTAAEIALGVSCCTALLRTDASLYKEVYARVKSNPTLSAFLPDELDFSNLEIASPVPAEFLDMYAGLKQTLGVYAGLLFCHAVLDALIVRGVSWKIVCEALAPEFGQAPHSLELLYQLKLANSLPINAK
jgi:hypothetical protein